MINDNLRIRKAQLTDIDAVKTLADANRDALGFVLRPALVNSIERKWLLVAEQGGKVIGFVSYRHRRDPQTTVYEICVDVARRRNGIGRALIEALAREASDQGKTRIRLKAPAELPANDFYRAVGFALKGTELGKNRHLNIWEASLNKKGIVA